jgi:hypothetical protein
MQPQPLRIAIPIICLVGMVGPLQYVVAEGFVHNLSELCYILIFYFGPFIIVALLGSLKTKSRKLPVMLLVAAILIVFLSLVMSNTHDQLKSGGNGQGGMGLAFLFLLQWFIAVIAIITAIIIAFVHKRRERIRRAANKCY